MRLAARTDANQASIVSALRAIGGKVVVLSSVGNGCPDLLVGFRRRNILLECKVVGGRLTKAQEEFLQGWPGEAWIVQSVDQALTAVIGKEAMK